MNENRNGLLLERDELNGFLKTLDREDRPNDRAFYLEVFNGQGSYTYDRIGRGTVTIEAAILSLVGTIQPSVIIPYLRKSITQSFDDGLIQRLQLMVYPDPIAFRNVDRSPDQQAKDKAYTTFRLLDTFSAPTDENGVRGIRFTPDAQALSDDWRLQLEALIRSGEVHPALESHFTKYRSLIPAIALIIQLARRTDYEQIDTWAVEKALVWYRYLKSHAERIYTMGLNNDNLNARTILSKIKHGKLTNPLKAWKIQQAGCGVA